MSTSIQNQSSPHNELNLVTSDSRSVEDTDADELRQHGYDYCYLNLLSIFGDRLPSGKIRQLAAECTRMRLRQGSEFYKFLYGLPELIDAQPSGNLAELPLRLQGWDLDLLRRVLTPGKGLILCAHHFGLYRHILVELALLGFKVSSFVDKASYDQSAEAFDAVNGSLKRNADGCKRTDTTVGQGTPINLLCIDDHSFSNRVAQALRRGEIVLVFIDGNTGWDGPWGSKSKITVEFLGLSIVVKNGAARLAAALGAPLLSVLTPKTSDNFGQVILGQPIIPPARSNRSTRDGFISDSMQSLYNHLSEFVSESPEQWESVRSFHRWRVKPQPEPDSNPLNNEQQEVMRLLGLGATFNIDERRFAPLETQVGRVWIDVKNLRTYRHGQSVENVLRVILQENGINQFWIEQQRNSADANSDIVAVLGYLKKLKQVIAH